MQRKQVVKLHTHARKPDAVVGGSCARVARVVSLRALGADSFSGVGSANSLEVGDSFLDMKGRFASCPKS